MSTKRNYFLIALIVVLLFIGTATVYAGRITCEEAGDNCKKDLDCDDAAYGIDCIIHYCNVVKNGGHIHKEGKK